MKELGVSPKVAEEQKVTLFDGVFDGKDPQKYARSFPVRQRHIARRPEARPPERTLWTRGPRATAQGGPGDNVPPGLKRLIHLGPGVGRRSLARPGVVGRQHPRARSAVAAAARWDESRLYILEPFVKRGETDQGIALLAYYSLMRVGRGFLLGS